jgi:hypothetical protein
VGISSSRNISNGQSSARYPKVKTCQDPPNLAGQPHGLKVITIDATCKTYKKLQKVADMNLVTSVVTWGRPFKVLGVREVHKIRTAGNFSGGKALIWLGYL